MCAMRALALALLLASACTDDPDPAANLCPGGADRAAECEARCKTGDDRAEVCAPDLETECLDECVRCNPQEAWCPGDR